MTSLIAQSNAAQSNAPPNHLVVVDPGHFHATLLQKEMYPELDPRVAVYAPLGPELLDYLNRISLFNTRPENPTHWALDTHSSPNFLDEMRKQAVPGSIAVFSGRNRGKIDRIIAALSSGLHVLADKPWILSSADMPKLEQSLDLATSKHLAAYDIMTERYESAAQLQRVLVNSPEVFGHLVTGNAQNPAIQARSVHHIMKVVAGVPLRRPVWFFDVADYGEGLSDVGTHPVDLIHWTAFPDQILDYRKDIQMVSGRHEPLKISLRQFEQVTGAKSFPAALAGVIHDNSIDYYCNNYIQYAVRGIHVKLDVLWAWEAPQGAGDVYEASFQGSRARIELRQSAATKFSPEVYVLSSDSAVQAAIDRRIGELQSHWPGIQAVRNGNETHMHIPAQYRVGHEEHFGQVAKAFFRYVHSPDSMPEWERANMLAKYYVTTKGVELAKEPVQ